MWLAVCALSVAGLLEPFDRALYDGFARLTPQSSPPEVVLVSAPPGAAATIDWSRLCAQVAAAELRTLVIALPIDPAAAESAARSACAGQLLAGVLIPDDAAGEERAAANAALFARLGLRVGVSRLGDRSDQVRERWAGYELGGRRYRSLEALAADAVALRGERFIPDLRIAAEHFPALTLQRVLDEGIVPEIGRNRIAILGPAPDPFLQSLSVPGQPRAVSLLTYEGMVIDALAKQALIHAPGPLLRAGTLALIALLLIFVLQALPLRAGVLLLAATLLGEAVVTFALLGVLGVWPPLTELLLLETGVFLAVYRGKASAEARRLREILGSTTGKLQRRTRPDNILQSGEHWASIARMVDQTLQLNRTIFLERVAGDHRVREIIALRCGVSEIDEKRRDYERTPYTTAIAARGAIRVDRYLRAIDATEQQFLVPLVFGGEVMGFWAFGIDEGHLAGIPDLQAEVNQIAEQVAGLLYQRKIWQEQAASEERSWDRVFEDSNFVAYRELNQSVLLMENRLASLERIFATQVNAAILYDVFGRVVLVNPRMTELLAPAGIAPYKLTATDLVAQLSAISLNEARSLIRYLVIDRQPISLPATIDGDGQHCFALKAQALIADDSEDGTPPSPFSVNGILVELIDISDAQRLADIKADLALQASYKLANQLESLLVAAHLLAADDLQEAERHQIAAMAAQATADACATVRRTRAALLGEPVAYGGCYPIDPVRVLLRALHDTAGELEKCRLRADFAVPELRTLAMAVPDELYRLFVAAIRFLASDATSGSALRVRIAEGARQLEVCFASEGFGMPQASLRESLEGDVQNAASESVRDLRQMRHAIAHWGGALEIASTVGSGSEVCVRLATFWGQAGEEGVDDA